MKGLDTMENNTLIAKRKEITKIVIIGNLQIQ